MRSNPLVHDMNGIWWTLIRLLVYIKHEVAEYWIDATGSVIRTNQQGAATCFDKKCKILPLKNVKGG